MIQRYLTPVILSSALLSFACTNGQQAVTAHEPTAAVASQSKTSSACTASQLASFSDTNGVALDLEHETLPKGLYLARLSELLLVKKDESGQIGRLVAREVSGSRVGEIICTENMAVFGDDFNLAVLAPVKFDASLEANSGNITVRQFYVFADKSGHGLVLSNPELDRQGQDLKSFLSQGASRGQIVRYSNRQYAIRLTRDQDGAQARLLIRLDLVKSN